jgi:hypothetical protein
VVNTVWVRSLCNDPNLTVEKPIAIDGGESGISVRFQRAKLCRPIVGNPRGDGVRGPPRGSSSRSWAEPKDVHVKESHLLGERDGVFKVFVRFAWESGHDVGCDGGG